MQRKPFQDRFNALKQEAQSWSSAWKDIQTFLCPTRGQFDNAEPNQGPAINHKKILNGHATRCLNRLASGMTSGLTSPSRPWFKLGLADEELEAYDPVKFWLNMVQSRMMAVYSRSNIYGVLYAVYAECGGFGGAAAMVLEDPQTVIRGRNFTCGEYYIGTGPDCRPNAFGRTFWFTVAQTVKEFGLEKCGETVKNLWNNGQVDKWVNIIHLIQPNEV